MGQPATDEELVERMSRGDRAALGSLYERHAPRLRGLALVILRDAEADDVLHDVFIEAWRRSAEYSRNRGTVSAWLALRTRSRAIDRLRARKVRAEGDIAAGLRPASGDPSADSVRTFDRARLRGLLTMMSEAEQEVLVLGYFEGLSSSEIGERMGVPIGTVKSRVRSALAKLRHAFEPEKVARE